MHLTNQPDIPVTLKLLRPTNRAETSRRETRPISEVLLLTLHYHFPLLSKLRLVFLLFGVLT